MKNGFRVYDSDTHVNPAAEVLERYVDPGFRPRLAELEPYRFAVGQGAVGGVEGLHNYRVGTKYYRRVLGEQRAARDLHRPRDEMDGQQDAAARRAGRPGRKPRQGHG